MIFKLHAFFVTVLINNCIVLFQENWQLTVQWRFLILLVKQIKTSKYKSYHHCFPGKCLFLIFKAIPVTKFATLKITKSLSKTPNVQNETIVSLSKFYGINIKPGMNFFCKYRNSEDCPIVGKCRASNVIYQANIYPKQNKSNNNIYIRVWTGKWKQSLYNNRHPFSNPKWKFQTALLKISELREKDLYSQIDWKTIVIFSNS